MSNQRYKCVLKGDGGLRHAILVDGDTRIQAAESFAGKYCCDESACAGYARTVEVRVYGVSGKFCEVIPVVLETVVLVRVA